MTREAARLVQAAAILLLAAAPGRAEFVQFSYFWFSDTFSAVSPKGTIVGAMPSTGGGWTPGSAQVGSTTPPL